MKQIKAEQEYRDQVNQDELTVGIFTTTCALIVNA